MTVDNQIIDPVKAQELMISQAGRNLPRLYISTLLLRSAFGVVTILLPVYLHDLSNSGLGPEFSGLQIGLIVGSIFLSEIALVTIMGRLSDVMQRRIPFIVVGNIIAAISLAMFSFFTSFAALFIAHFVEGIGAAMVTGPALAMIGDSSKPEERGEKMGLYETVTFGGMAIGFLVGGFLYDFLGGIEGNGKYTFLISGLFLIGGAIYASQMHEPHALSFKEEFSIVKRFYRETIPHLYFLLIGMGMILTVNVLSLVGGIGSESMSLLYVITGSGVNLQFKVIFWGAGFFLLVMGLIDFYLEETATTEERVPLGGENHNHFTELTEAMSDKDLKRILPAWYMVMTILGTIVTFLPLILKNGSLSAGPAQGDIPAADQAISEGLNTSQVGLYFVVGVTLMGGLQILFGKLVDKWGRKPVLSIGVTSIMLLTLEVVLAILFFPSWFGGFTTPDGTVFMVVAALTGMGVSAFGPAALAVLADNSDVTNRGTTSGIYSLLLGLGHLSGDIIGGVIWDLGQELGGDRGAAAMIFGFCFVLAGLAFFFVHAIHETKEESQDVIGT